MVTQFRLKISQQSVIFANYGPKRLEDGVGGCPDEMLMDGRMTIRVTLIDKGQANYYAVRLDQIQT